MSLDFGEDLQERVKDIVVAEALGALHVSNVIAAGTLFYKLQAESYGRKGIYFNPKSENRFSLANQSKWPMYMADSPHTACKEFYQEERFIDRTDFTTNCMVEIRIEHPVVVFDEKKLAPHLGVAVGDLMAPKTVYAATQKLAQALAQHADGFRYLSRQTGETCVVLWSDNIEGNGMVTSVSVTPLSEYAHHGITAREILKCQLGMRIT